MTLTIFIPAYNAAAYLAATLDSLLSQSFQDFELIVVDDGSTDTTSAIAQSYADGDSRVRVIRSPHRGEVAARNKALGVSHPSSLYFLNHDSDDISLPGKLEKQVRYLETHPEISIVGTLAEYFDDRGQNLGKPPLEMTPERIRCTFHQVNSMVNSASMIRREVFETIGGYREEFRSVDDYDFFTRALLAGSSLANLPEILHRIRLHPNSVGSTRGALQEKLAKQIRAIYVSHGDSQVPTILKSPLTLSHSYRPGKPSRRLRILHTVQMYYPQIGGSEEVVKQISERLVQRGHHVTVATGLHPKRNFSQWNGVEIRQFNVSGNQVHGIHGDVEAYQQFVLNGDFDVVVNYAAQIWSSDLVYPLLDRIRAAKVFIPCGYSALSSPAFGSYFERLPSILKKYDRVVHLSGNYRDAQFSSRNLLTNSTVIGNAASEEEFLQPSGGFRLKHKIQTPHLAITVANHYHGKGHNHLLGWFSELNRGDLTLAIIGNRVSGGCWKECLDEASTLPNVRFFEDLPREEVVSAYKEADFFWFGSDVECFPLVILEAMAAQIPWLSTDVGNVRELAGGLVAAPGEMVTNANALLNSKDWRARRAREGYEEWKAKYTWQRIVDKYEQLYGDVTTASRRTVAPTEKGRVSVVIPCYKQAHFLTEAVESVLEQSYRDFEVIIVDDGSPDDTKQTAKRLIQRYPGQKVRLISHPNRGLAASRNAGIQAACGEFILPLDADDRIKPEFLQACIDKISAEPDASIVAVDLEEFGDSNRKIRCSMPVLERIALENQINYCSLFRRSLWEKVGGYKTSMRWGFEDWDFWISCLAGGARVTLVRDYLFQYRKRGASMYSSALDHSAELLAQIVVNHPGLYEASTEEWANALLRVRDADPSAGDNLDNGDNRTLARYFVSRARWHEALPYLKALIETPDVPAEFVFLFGAAALKMKDFSGGQRALRRFLDVHPDNASAQFLSALAAACLGDLRSALAHAEDAIELDLKMTAGYELLIAVCRAIHEAESVNDLVTRCSELQIQVAPWVFSETWIKGKGTEDWTDLLYSKFLEFSPLPLLELNPSRVAKPAVSQPVVRVEAEVKVSVIMPTFNRPEMLAAAIDSVRRQTLQNFEILVVNDAGLDVDGVVSKRNKSRKITCVRHGRNRGLAAARNTGIKLARGEYIAYLDDDDLFYPDHLQTLVHCLENRDCSVAYTDAHRAHQQEQDGKAVVTHRDLPFSIDFDHDRILVGNFIPVLCVMHRRNCLDETGLFDESLTTHEDWEMWIRISRKYRFAHIRKTTCEFSWRTDGTSMTSQKQRDFLRTLEVIYKKTELLAQAKPHVQEARTQYFTEKKRLILDLSSHDNSGGRVSVSLV